MNSSQYRRHFLLTAGMILLSFALLGFTFIGLSYNYSVQDQRANLNEKSRYIAALTGQVILLEPDQTDHFSAYLGAGARLTDSDVFLCDNDGEIFFCYEGGEIRSESVGSYIPNSVLTKLKSTGGYDDMTTLGLFAEQRFVSAAPITITRGPMTLTSGYAFVSVSTENLTSMWRTFATIFFFTAVVVLMIAFISSSIASHQTTKPLADLTSAVRRFGMGEYDVRVEGTDRKDELGDLSRAFNAMADSIALAEEKRTEFISNVSHELKTPMTTIAGFAEGILDGTIPKEREREYLQTISDETRRLSRLVRRLLDASRMAAQENVVISQMEFDIEETMAQVLISLEGKINAKGLDVDARFPDGPVMVWGDPDGVTQVCYNLLDNAIKFSHPNTVITVSIVTRGSKAFISVRDIGETIPEEELPLIFDRLHKSDRSRSLDKEGVGLGLYLVKQILSNLKETISVTSKDNVTEFIFTLTLAQ